MTEDIPQAKNGNPLPSGMEVFPLEWKKVSLKCSIEKIEKTYLPTTHSLDCIGRQNSLYNWHINRGSFKGFTILGYACYASSSLESNFILIICQIKFLQKEFTSFRAHLSTMNIDSGSYSWNFLMILPCRFVINASILYRIRFWFSRISSLSVTVPASASVKSISEVAAFNSFHTEPFLFA